MSLKTSFRSIALAGFALAAATSALEAQTTLKEAYKGIFHVGVAVNQRQFREQDPRALPIVATQFDQISPENELKWEVVHPQPDQYNWGPADAYVAFGEKNKMFIVGHCLVWHSQVPQWVFQGENGQPATRELLLQRMRDHIMTVVGRYKGRINGWDVVNEAVNDQDGTLRNSQWRRIIGDDFIVKAFQYAHEADPKAELYYNDYSVENETKRKGVVEIVKQLKAAGVPITAVGLQGHNNMKFPTLQQQADTIEAFKALGVKVCVTELDVDVLPEATRGPAPTADVSARGESTANSNPYVNGLPDEMQQALAKRYAELFGVYLKYRDTVSRVTFWGVTDGDSWKNNFPVRGRTNYPLLFDRQGKGKPALDAVIQAAKSVKK
jgi:endo-1,4-beta-xylanase